MPPNLDPNLKELKAEYDDSKEFTLDPLGYFLIRINKEKKEIEAGFCKTPNIISILVKGTSPLEIYQTIINKVKLDIRKDHCAYLGRELQKAFLALKLNLDYIQDEELNLNT